MNDKGVDFCILNMCDAKLCKCEAMLRETQKLAKLGRWEYLHASKTLIWSDSIFEIFEIDKNKVSWLMQAFLDTVHPEDRYFVKREWMNSLENKLPYETTHRLLMNDGRIKWVNEKCKTVFDEDGLPIESVGIVQDITELIDITEYKRVEIALKEKSHQLELAMDAGEHGFWDWNMLSDEIYFSPTYYTMLGYEPGELPMKVETWVNLLHPDDREQILSRIMGYLFNAQPYTVEFRLRTKNGRWKWISGRGKSYELDANGKPHRAIGVHVDIDRLMQSKRMVEEERRLLESVLDAVPDIIAIQDTDHTINRYNKAGYQFLNMTYQDVYNRKCYELIGRDRECEVCATRKAIETKQLVQLDKYVPEMGIYLECRSNPVIDEDGNVVRIIEQMRDITQRKKYEMEFIRLDRLNLVGQLAAGIGHEIRNPMTTVRGYLQLLGEKPAYIAQKSTFELMISELDRANEIITEFLSLAQTKQTDLKFHNLNDIVNNLYPLIEADTFTQNKQITCMLGEIPNLKLNEKEIVQMVLNLSRNGLEAMKEQGLLTIKSYVEEGNVILSIKDEGSGISPENLNKLGTPFFTTKDTGTGLGLATCYRIAESHNAKIEINSCSRGTEFLIIFPIPDFRQV